MKVAFKTLGCRLNQFETDALAAQFRNNGYEVSECEDGADVIVVNTCTVTNQSNQKSRHVISHAGKFNPNAKLFITGCMAVSHKEQLAKKFPTANVIDNKQKSAIFHSVDSVIKTGTSVLEETDYDLFSYQSFTEMFHTRSLVKIQDGCDNFCTFCIIPFVRGRGTSRSVEKVLENVRYLVSKGAKELVLTGVNISRYNDNGVRFSDLLEQILNIDGDFRVRISSIEPDEFDERFFSLVNHPRLAPHLHLCLQSGSDRILLQMRRMYTMREFHAIVDRVRSINPLFNITTDAIVGFPGETDEDFEATMAAARTIGFGHMHIFKYSVRKDTRAERMPNHVPEKIKTERSQALHQLAAELTKQYRQKFDNTEQRILVEKFEDGVASGYNDYYVPMQFNSDNKKRNRFEIVVGRVKDFEGND